MVNPSEAGLILRLNADPVLPCLPGQPSDPPRDYPSPAGPSWPLVDGPYKGREGPPRPYPSLTRGAAKRGRDAGKLPPTSSRRCPTCWTREVPEGMPRRAGSTTEATPRETPMPYSQTGGIGHGGWGVVVGAWESHVHAGEEEKKTPQWRRPLASRNTQCKG